MLRRDSSNGVICSRVFELIKKCVCKRREDAGLDGSPRIAAQAVNAFSVLSLSYTEPLIAKLEVTSKV